MSNTPDDSKEISLKGKKQRERRADSLPKAPSGNALETEGSEEDSIEELKTRGATVEKPLSPMQESMHMLQEESGKRISTLNLEDVIQGEVLVWTIYQNLKRGIDPTTSCQEWWFSSETSSVESLEESPLM